VHEDERVEPFVGHRAGGQRLQDRESHHPDQRRVLDEDGFALRSLNKLLHAPHLLPRSGRSPATPASRIVLSPSGVTRVVDRLEQRGLVERCVFEDDKRGSIATLTADGRALLRTAANVQVHDVREHFLKHLSRRQLEHLTTALEAVLDGEGSPLPPLSTS
jgi:DNA-binding MarR family transcriptional regulator